jgi:hypothetical protein
LRWHECRNPTAGRSDTGGYRFKSIEQNYEP